LSAEFNPSLPELGQFKHLSGSMKRLIAKGRSPQIAIPLMAAFFF